MNIEGQKVRIRSEWPDDFARVTSWRQDKEIAALDVIAGENFNVQKFSIETLDKIHIGACNLYNHTPTDVQIGIMIGDKGYWSRGYGTDAVNLLVDYAFVSMNVERVWLKVLPWNTRAIRCYEKCGFLHTGKLALEGYEFLVMERRRTYGNQDNRQLPT